MCSHPSHFCVENLRKNLKRVQDDRWGLEFSHTQAQCGDENCLWGLPGGWPKPKLGPSGHGCMAPSVPMGSHTHVGPVWHLGPHHKPPHSTWAQKPAESNVQKTLPKHKSALLQPHATRPMHATTPHLALPSCPQSWPHSVCKPQWPFYHCYPLEKMMQDGFNFFFLKFFTLWDVRMHVNSL